MNSDNAPQPRRQEFLSFCTRVFSSSKATATAREPRSGEASFPLVGGNVWQPDNDDKNFEPLGDDQQVIVRNSLTGGG
eukprot:CAMPEP_0168172464 /NCGR_PEP_ID=MMETSP0139_2-20121125/5281_1 /TAXON_ID=44445 /ORGANISM="Pseudo-nitzschia australis, Strain 10249 10 AB" /LENGTH=77 /DNA_ID=CAMNT_0008090143 /DNA_START=976 /DNA_END=1209 /DNA_ORIENTATION=-